MLAVQTGDEPRFKLLIRVVEDLNSESGELYVLFQSIFRVVKGVMRQREKSYSDAAEYSNTTLEMKEVELLLTKA
jgi:hypothetical protein